MTNAYTIPVVCGILLAVKRLSLIRALLVIAVFAIGLLIHLYSAGLLFNHVNLNEFYEPSEARLHLGWMVKTNQVYWSSLFGAFVCSWLGTYVVQWLFQKLSSLTRMALGKVSLLGGLFQSKGVTRSKVLIGIAIILFVLGTIQNVIVANKGSSWISLPDRMLSFNSRNGPGLAGMMFGVLVNLLVVGAALYVPLRIATCKWTFARKWLVFLGISIALLTCFGWYLSAFDLVRWNSDETNVGLAIFAAIPTYLFGMLYIAKSNQPADRIVSHLPSIWPIAILAPLVLAMVLFSNRYDVVTLLQWNRSSKAAFANVFEAANYVKQVQRDSGGNITLRFNNYGSTQTWIVDVRDEKDGDILSYPFTAAPYQTILIRNLQPFVDTSLLTQPVPAKTAPGSPAPAPGTTCVSIFSGEATSKQLKELSVASTTLTIAGDVDLPDNCQPGDEITSWVSFLGEGEYRPLAAFLRNNLNVNGLQIMISSELKIEDWNAIVDVSQNRPVMILKANNIPKELLNSPELVEADSRPWTNITIQLQLHEPHGLKTLKGLLELAEKKDLNLTGFWILEEKTKWGISFLLNGKGTTPDMTVLDQIPKEEFLATAKESGWIYEESDAGDPLAIWLPDSSLIPLFENELKGHKTLRLDVRGLNGSVAVGSVLCESNDLMKLPGLENLFLPTGVQFDHLGFLGKLPNLKRLQIHTQDRTVQTVGGGFEQCKTLEELILFGTPDAKTIAELASLKKLKRLHLVDDELGFTTEEEKATLKKQLPNVAISFIDPDNFEPFVSDAWQQNLKEVRKRVLADIESKLNEFKNSQQ